MAEFMQPSALCKRILDWAKEERVGGLMPNSTRVLAHYLWPGKRCCQRIDRFESGE